jgi:DNA polymerase-3 subunit delta'
MEPSPVWKVFGQDSLRDHLASTHKKGSLHHAYLFTGPEKTGKKLMAMDLAKALNCESQDAPCDCCDSCRRIDAFLHTDVWLVDLSGQPDGAASRKEISTGEIQEIQHSASLPPFEGRTRVFIIDGAENLSSFAANRLLKTLEEPPPRVVFILLAESSDNVLTTIVSRCQHMVFKNVNHSHLALYISQQFKVDDAKAKLVAQLSGGHPGWAITAVKNQKILTDFIEKRDRLLGLYQANREEKFSYAEDTSARFGSDRQSVIEELKIWQTLTRDILYAQFGLEENIINCDVFEPLRELAGLYSTQDIRNILFTIGRAIDQLGHNVTPRLVMETMMLALECPEAVAVKL